MLKQSALILALGLALSSSVTAQAPNVTVSHPIYSYDTTPAATPLTADEKKEIEILTLKAQVTTLSKQVSDLKADSGACQAQLGPAQFEQNRQQLMTEQSALKERVEKARPGFTWDPNTGVFTPKSGG